MRPHPLALALAALLGAGSAGLVACGGGGDAVLIPGADASALESALGEVAQATRDGDCAQAIAALRRAQQAFGDLPQTVDARLRTRISDGLEQLAKTVPTQCREGRTTTTTTPTTSATTDTTTSDTTETTTTTTAPPTTTTTTTTTPPPTTTTTTPTPADPGGISPDAAPAEPGQ